MDFYDFPCIGNNIPNWRTHIVQRDWNHQPDNNYHYIYIIIVVIIASIIVHFYFCVIIIMITELVCFIS